MDAPICSSRRFSWLVQDPSRLEDYLLAEPDLVHMVDEYDWTLLMHACSDGRLGHDLGVVQLLVMMGADPLQSTKQGSAFGMCAVHGHVDIADYLAKVQTDNRNGNRNGKRPRSSARAH